MRDLIDRSKARDRSMLRSITEGFGCPSAQHQSLDWTWRTRIDGDAKVGEVKGGSPSESDHACF